MKKIISLMLAAAMCMGSIVFASENYSDVDSNALYANVVERLYDFGVMRGYEDGTFRPDRLVTRAEAAALMCAAVNIHADDIPDDIGDDTIVLWNDGGVYVSPFDDYDTPGFSDVDENHWAYKFIIYASRMHPAPIQGYEGMFHPDMVVTYQEFIKMCVSLIGHNPLAAQMGYPQGYIRQAESLSLTAGLGKRNYESGMTRADAAVILANTLEAPILGNGERQTNYYTGAVGYAPEAKNGTGERYQNLLSIYFDIYKVTASIFDPDAPPKPAETQPADTAYETAVKDLTELYILDDDFDPDAEITKGGFARYARRLMYPSDEPVYPLNSIALRDALSGRDDINLMVVLGYMRTNNALEFGTDDKMTFGAAAESLVRMIYGSSNNYGYVLYTRAAYEYGITANIENAKEKSGADILTGRELAIMLYNCLDKTMVTASADNKPVTAEGNTIRNKLDGFGGVNIIEDKGEKAGEFERVKIVVKEGPDVVGQAGRSTKIGTVTLKNRQDLIISLDNPCPKYVNYFVRVVSVDGTFVSESADAYAPGDMLALTNAKAGEYEVYLSTTCAPVTVSGSIYARDAY